MLKTRSCAETWRVWVILCRLGYQQGRRHKRKHLTHPDFVRGSNHLRSHPRTDSSCFPFLYDVTLSVSRGAQVKERIPSSYPIGGSL